MGFGAKKLILLFFLSFWPKRIFLRSREWKKKNLFDLLFLSFPHFLLFRGVRYFTCIMCNAVHFGYEPWALCNKNEAFFRKLYIRWRCGNFFFVFAIYDWIQCGERWKCQKNFEQYSSFVVVRVVKSKTSCAKFPEFHAHAQLFTQGSREFLEPLTSLMLLLLLFRMVLIAT